MENSCAKNIYKVYRKVPAPELFFSEDASYKHDVFLGIVSKFCL